MVNFEDLTEIENIDEKKESIHLFEWPNADEIYIDKDLELYGWIDVRRDHGKLIFFDLRDRSGKVQLVVTPNDPDLHKIAETLRPEWVVKISGKVVKRPDAMKNLDEPTGEIEIKVSGILVRDYQGKFEKDATRKFLRGIYEKWVIPARIEHYEDKIIGQCDEFLSQAKAYLDLEGKK